MESCIEALLNGLVGKGYQLIVHPHPQYIRHHGGDIKRLAEKYRKYEGEVVFEDTFSSFESVYTSDLLITDWSGVGYEFSFTTCRPVLFIHTPMKIMNPEYKAIGIENYDERMRVKLGVDLAPTDLEEKVGGAVADLLSSGAEYSERIDRIRREERFNYGCAAPAGAADILDQLKRRQEKNRQSNAH